MSIDKIVRTHYCYILQQKEKEYKLLNYVGYTVNVKRRIRQHNCEIVGGARYTKHRGPWEYLLQMTCSTWDHIRGLQVEWLIKHPTRKRKRPKEFSGSLGRIKSLLEIFKRVPINETIKVYIHEDFYENAVTLNLPSNIILLCGFEELDVKSEIDLMDKSVPKIVFSSDEIESIKRLIK